MMPMFVMAGSASTHATSPGASARSRAATSFHSITLVVTVGSTGGPALPGLGPGTPSLMVMIVSSTEPW
jgi:hypothetical protein